MIILKLLINLVPALFVIFTIYLTFYFDIIPGLIRHFRRALRTNRKYEKEIADIQKEDSANGEEK